MSCQQGGVTKSYENTGQSLISAKVFLAVCEVWTTVVCTLHAHARNKSVFECNKGVYTSTHVSACYKRVLQSREVIFVTM